MTPRESGAAMARRLAAEIASDRRALAERDAELDEFLSSWTGSEDAQAAAVSLVLERSYTGLEALLERVVRSLDGDLPRVQDWHRGLLEAASLDVDRVRPAVLRRSVGIVDEIRRFRHFLRHAYASRLDPTRVRELAGRWKANQASRDADLDDFMGFLDGLAERLDGVS